MTVLILSLPVVASIVVYFIVNPRRQPTRRDAIGMVVTLAGSGAPGVQDGPNRAASFSDPFGLAIDSKGNVFVADGGRSNSIRVITTKGVVAKIAGSSEGFDDGKLESASFNTPSGLAIDRRGSVIIADTSNNRIRRLDVDGNVTTVAGSGESGFKDGPASQSRFDGPIGVAVDDRGNIFVADSYNDRVRKIATDGTVSTLAGTGSPGFINRPGEAAQFDTPCGVAVDRQGNLFVADTGNDAIRKITPSGEVTTFAGGQQGHNDGWGTEAGFNQPTGIAITYDGFLFVTDEGGGRIRRITPEGEVTTFAGTGTGFGDGAGKYARFNGPCGIAIDRPGNVYVADNQNYLIRKISPADPSSSEASLVEEQPRQFIQPSSESDSRDPDSIIPRLGPSLLELGQSFPWPLKPQGQWHEVTGLVGEARGAPGGIALNHLHSGLDLRGNMGDPVLSVVDEKVTSPLPNWDYRASSEGIHVGLFSYIHVRIGRDKSDQIQDAAKFKTRVDETGNLMGVRVRRGTRFRVGEFIGTLNSLYHVHLNLGPWNAQANPVQLPFPKLTDTTPPVVEPKGIEIVSASGEPFSRTREGRLVISGDVDIVITAYDKVDGNVKQRKLGLYKAGYQLTRTDGAAVKGFEQPMINIEFNRLPPDDSSVFVAYAEGSGVSAYGGATRFRLVVTNRVRDGQAVDGVLRTSDLLDGNYTLRIVAEDYAGNRASGKATELQITVVNH
ncbi:MAG TPA: NHL repeat-containing protein [Blastocatellia bacterium]|nr:NHL repeat-containing protein [Blastocatellia bacterium]